MPSMSTSEKIDTYDAQYVCTFRLEPEGGYTVRCEAFPEIVTFGGSLDEARGMAREAIELCLEVYQDEGRPIPPSDSDPQQVIKQAAAVKLARV